MVAERSSSDRLTRAPRGSRYALSAGWRPTAEQQISSGHLDRSAPRFRIGPERATQAITARRSRRFSRGGADTAAQRNFAPARAKSLNYFGERTIGLPLVKTAAASRRRGIAAGKLGPAFSRREYPQNRIHNRACFHAWPAASFTPCWLRTEQRLDQRPLVISQIVEQHHVSPQRS